MTPQIPIQQEVVYSDSDDRGVLIGAVAEQRIVTFYGGYLRLYAISAAGSELLDTYDLADAVGFAIALQLTDWNDRRSQYSESGLIAFAFIDGTSVPYPGVWVPTNLHACVVSSDGNTLSVSYHPIDPYFEDIAYPPDYVHDFRVWITGDQEQVVVTAWHRDMDYGSGYPAFRGVGGALFFDYNTWTLEGRMLDPASSVNKAHWDTYDPGGTYYAQELSYGYWACFPKRNRGLWINESPSTWVEGIRGTWSAGSGSTTRTAIVHYDMSPLSGLTVSYAYGYFTCFLSNNPPYAAGPPSGTFSWNGSLVSGWGYVPGNYDIALNFTGPYYAQGWHGYTPYGVVDLTGLGTSDWEAVAIVTTSAGSLPWSFYDTPGSPPYDILYLNAVIDNSANAGGTIELWRTDGTGSEPGVELDSVAWTPPNEITKWVFANGVTTYVSYPGYYGD